VELIRSLICGHSARDRGCSHRNALYFRVLSAWQINAEPFRPSPVNESAKQSRRHLNRSEGPHLRFASSPVSGFFSNRQAGLGTLTDAERNWLVMRAQGGFGLTMTAAAHVQAIGQGFAGQLGTFSDIHIPGLTELASHINATGSVSIAQLHHAGNRAPADLIGSTPVCPSDDADTGARALSTEEVVALVADFVAAAQRCDTAGFDGVELHGAHGYIICQFLSSTLNRREDQYGGSLENRSRVLFEMIAGIRSVCRPDFIVGVRLSPERFGMDINEIRTVTQQLIDSDEVDFLDLSLWDCFKEPEDAAYKGGTLLEVATDLDRRTTPTGRRVHIGVAGKLHEPADIERALSLGADFAFLGRAAILHHDYPNRLAADKTFAPNHIPVTAAYLANEGLSAPFITYMSGWKGFVSE
jgi:2,4-dienoyl-CoA reductase-like NADH-dependent reductase (Old Yellow Enzyme family)